MINLKKKFGIKVDKKSRNKKYDLYNPDPKYFHCDFCGRQNLHEKYFDSKDFDGHNMYCFYCKKKRGKK